MSKLAQSFVKYVIHARFEASGIVEKPDVIGAIFGQTEGLLGDELELRELQRTGRIGRIAVILRTRNGRSEGDIIVPSSLDMSETSIIASALETIDKIGPCDAKIVVKRVEDVRTQKRRYIVERAKEILRQMLETSGEDAHELSEMIKEAVRTYEISSYEGLSCGPNIENYDEIIIVEGRADVINLLRCGIKNVIAIEGTNIPKTIIKLSKEKVTTAFLDGDRGGDLILKKLLDIAEIDYVARAPEGKEVEELSKKEIYKSLRERVPADQIKRELTSAQEPVTKFVRNRERAPESDVKTIRKYLEHLIGTRAAYILDKNCKILAKIPLSEVSIAIAEFPQAYGLLVDSKITQQIIDLALARKIKLVGGMKIEENVKTNGVKVYTYE